MNIKSPFKIYQGLISPLMCEQIIDDLNLTSPDKNNEDKTQPTLRFNEAQQYQIFSRVSPLIPEICEYYDTQYRGTHQMQFVWYTDGASSGCECDNSVYSRGKWVRNRDRDLTCVLFLNDYNNAPPFEHDYEVYGGKYEFPQHDFGMMPQRGTLVVYPSGPHFINSVQPVKVGSSIVVKWFMSTERPYLYDPSKFPGNLTSWFKEVA